MNRIGQHQGVELHPYAPQLAQAPRDNRVQQIVERSLGTSGMLKAIGLLSGVGAMAAAILAPSALPLFLTSGAVSLIALLILSCQKAEPVNLGISLDQAQRLETDFQNFYDRLGNDLDNDVVLIEEFLGELAMRRDSHWIERYRQGISIHLEELKSRLSLRETAPTRRETFTRLAHDSIAHLKQYLQEAIGALRDFQDSVQRLIRRTA